MRARIMQHAPRYTFDVDLLADLFNTCYNVVNKRLIGETMGASELATIREKAHSLTMAPAKDGEKPDNYTAEKFSKFVNTREFENQVTGIVKAVALDDADIEVLKSEIKNDTDSQYAFVLFFILFSWLRRNHYQAIDEFYDEYGKKFKSYKIDVHIRGMIVVYTESKPKAIKKMIDEVGALIDATSQYHDFNKHNGVLNLYSELICKYFESEIDERSEPENIELLKKALNKIDAAIDDEESKNGVGKAYSKFYLIKGRVLVLLKRYDEGEDYIRKAVSLISLTDTDRAVTVSDYSQYLVKSSMIRAFDLNAEKFGELEKFKVESYKSVTLIMAIVGFLLGGINIFAIVNDTKTLLLLMAGYFGLVLLLAGIVLLGLSLSFKKKYIKSFIFDGILILSGAAVFAVTLCLIIFNVV